MTGLAAGQQVTLLNNGGNAKVVAANGAYTFTTAVAANGTYAVTVGTQPTGQTCSVANGSGAGVTANVTNANVTCSSITFTIGGTVTGLGAGEQVTLNNNGADATIVAADGAYTFATPVPFNGDYAVTVGTQPAGKTCSVANGTGAGVTANVSNANITCSAITFTIGGTVTGLAAGQQVTLHNNGGDATIVTANGAYTFTTPVAFNGSYAVTVGTQPTGQTCSVANGTGAGVTANVTNANITCSTITFTIGGTVSGLAAGQQVTLLNNGGDAKIVTANGAYTFTTPVPFNGNYAVTVGTQPTGQTCTVSNGTGERHRQRHQRQHHVLGDHLHHRGHDLRPGIDPAGDAQQQRRQSADRHGRRRRTSPLRPRCVQRRLCRHRGHAAHCGVLPSHQRHGHQRHGQRDHRERQLPPGDCLCRELGGRDCFAVHDRRR